MDILDTINSAFNGFNQDIVKILEIVTQSPSSNTAWQVITNIFNILLPVGYSLATLFFIMDFLNSTIKFDNVRWENIIKILLKLVIAKFVLENAFELLEMIFKFTASIATAIGTNPTAIKDLLDMDVLQTQIEAMGFWDKIWFNIQIIPTTIFMFLIKTVVKVMVYGRMIELFIYTGISPIPLATMVSEGLHGTAKRFLQTYSAICLQGVIIIIACMTYTGIFADILEPALGEVSLNVSAWSFIMSAMVLLLVVVKSGTWAKQITGSM